MSAIEEIQAKLEKYENLAAKRTAAVKKHYRKWIKPENPDSLTVEEQEEAQRKIERRKEKNREYYQRNKERILAYNKARYYQEKEAENEKVAVASA